MSQPSPLDALTEVRGAVAADLAGHVLGGVDGSPPLGDGQASAAATAIAALTRAGDAVGLHRLAMLQVRGGRAATVAAIRAEGFLLVAVDPGRPPARVEEALAGWTVPERPRDATPARGPAPSASTLLGGGDAAGGGSAVFSGSLGVFALPDLLEFLRSARRTGLLVCGVGGATGSLRFEEGLITAGTAPSVPSLGGLLLRARKVSALALRVLDIPCDGAETDRVAGERLVQEGLVDETTVRQALRQQVALAVRELMGWKDGQFAFTCAPADAPGSPLAIRVDPQGLLLQMCKELDEAARATESPGAIVSR